MAELTTRYNYAPLDARSIRVVVLSAAPNASHELNGRFETLSLDRPSKKFKALSYTWNGPLSRNLAVEGKSLLITPNCEAALRRLRSTKNELTIWIDAVCINQDDMSERSQQVTMMREIYEKAAGVCVWLGPDASSEVEAVMEELHSRWYNFSSTPLPSHPGLRELCKKPYWTRVWTVQEFRANSKCEIYCGNAPPVPKSHFQSTVPGENRLKNVISEEKNLMPLVAMHVLDEMGELQPSAYRIFLEALQATDPRDHVFAIRSVFENVLETVEVDYDAPPAEIFRKATAAVILTTSDLYIVVHYAHLQSPLEELPSWAADWGLQEPAPEWESTYKRTFFDHSYERPATSRRLLFPRTRAGEHGKPAVSFSEDFRKMHLTGKVIFTLQDLLSAKFTGALLMRKDGARQGSGHLGDIVTLREYLRRVFYLAKSQGPDTVNIPELLGRVNSAQLEAAVFGVWNLSSRRGYYSDLPTMCEALDADKDGTLYEKLLTTNDMGISSASRVPFADWAGKRLFCAEGRTGLCCARASPGDSVGIFHGADVALVFRQRGDISVFIGPCNVSALQDIRKLLDDETGTRGFTFM